MRRAPVAALAADPAPSDGAEPADGASAPSDASAASDGASAASSTPSTHVYVVLIDDAGFNDVGYQSADLGAATPFVDSLAESGVRLRRYYAHTSCTPSRSALLSGMFASSVGMQEKDVLSDSPFGLPLELALFPERVRQLGYATHLVGKWDVGHAVEAYWPTRRGFDTFFGLLTTNYDDYFNHTINGGMGVFTSLSNGTANAAAEYDGAYSTFAFGVPDAYRATPEFETLAASLPDGHSHLRETFAGALRLVDHEVEALVAALKAKRMWDDYVFVFASDNGASCMGDGGSNYPLRGRKSTPFEGGLRVPAFVHSLKHAPDARVSTAASPSTARIGGRPSRRGRRRAAAVIESSYVDEQFAVIRGDYKLVYYLNKYKDEGACCDNVGWWDADGTDVLNASAPASGVFRSLNLFKILDDPRETTNLLDVTRRRLSDEAATALDDLAEIYCSYYARPCARRMAPALYYEAEDADAIVGAWSDNGDVVTFWMDDAATQDAPAVGLAPQRPSYRAIEPFSSCGKRSS
ncbi:glycosyl transferase [Aureococcus anophagefferens]|nr:glycosyl transferase [Aureococcus anophagefferens]